MNRSLNLSRSFLHLLLGGLVAVASAGAMGCSIAGDDADQSGGAVNVGSKVVSPLTGGRIKIARAALGQRWVWRTTVTPANKAMPAAREFDDFQSVMPFVAHVVTFKDEGNGKWTLRDVAGAPGAEGAPGGAADAPLATFQAEESADSIVIDLDKGVREIVGDVSTFQWFAPVKLPKLPIKSTTLVGKATQEDDTVFLRRVAVLDLPADAPEALKKYERVRLDYAFGPYADAPAFEGRQNTEVGSFYVNPPVASAGNKPVSFVHRHDEGRPIVYAIPEATPRERADDIRTASQYWNGIFEKAGLSTRVQIETMATDVDGFLTNKNTIEFVTNAADGATGRGINQTDALTGRILKSNVHVSNVFTQAVTDVMTTRWITLQVEAGKEPTAPPAAILTRAVSDYYIDTFAHEIGHTLGLRHNFAGNLASSLDGPGFRKALDAYLGGDLPANTVLTTSIMDYLPTDYAMLLGAGIRLGREPLTYDLAAVRAAYAGEAVGAKDLGPYCEAELQETHVDCIEFDAGKSTLTDFTIAEADAERAARAVIGTKTNKGLGKAEEHALVLGTHIQTLLKQFLAEAKFVRADGGIAAHQRKGLAALSGELGTLVKHVVETRAIAAEDVSAVVQRSRRQFETYLTTARLNVASADLDAYFATVEAELNKGLAESLKSMGTAAFVTP